MSQHLYNNTNSSNSLEDIPMADERAEILALLSPLDPQMQHKKLQSTRVDTVGDRFLETEEFRSWYDRSGNGGSGSAVLFCCGDSGVGKTFISSLVVDKFCDQARRQSTVVVCFYLDRTSQEEQPLTDVLGSLLKQLIDRLDSIPKEVLDVFREEKMGVGGRALQFSQIAKLFQTIASLQRTIICIDALNECEVRDRLKLLSSLKEILQKSPGTQLFLTGKPDIRSEIETEFGGAATAVSITTTEDDVISYLRARLNEDPAPDAMDSILKADILNRITQNVPNILGLVTIKIDKILRETTIFDRRLRLSAMTKSNLGLDLQRGTPDLLAHSSPPSGISFSWGIDSPQPTLVGSYDIGLGLTQDVCSPEGCPTCGSSAPYHTCLASMLQGDSTDTHHNRDQDTEADRPSRSPFLCDCGTGFGRLTDLHRHRKTSKRHNKSLHGPACPVNPCKHPSRFTRVDNFKTHFMRRHGVSSDEADAFIREWRDRGMP